MRLIDADKLLRPGYTDMFDEPITFDMVSKKAVNRAPTVEAEPVRHRKWVKNDNGTYSCSECKSWIPNEQHYYARYCLFCGAKMDEEEENEQRQDS